MAEHFTWSPRGKRSNGFVPFGVDANSWLGFEQKIRERRLNALMEAVDSAMRRDDRDAAQRSLDEARELDPKSQHVRHAADRLAQMRANRAPLDNDLAWPRMFGAMGMLFFGVSLLVGIDWLHAPPIMPLAPPTVMAAPPLTPPAVPDVDAVATAGVIDAVAAGAVPMGTVTIRAVSTRTATTPAVAGVALERRSRASAPPPGPGPAQATTADAARARPTGWGRVLQPTARFFKSTLPKLLTSPI